MSVPFAVFIGICYLGFAVSCVVEGKYVWALVGMCWGIGNLGIAYEMYR